MIKREELNNPASCMSRAKDDEMTFVLLARDKAAPDAIRYWAWRRIDLGKNTADDPQIKEALECARTMDAAHSTPAAPAETRHAKSSLRKKAHEPTTDFERNCIPPASAPAETLGTCDTQTINEPHTKCPECVNWRPVAAPPSQHEQASTEKWQYPHPLRDVSMCDQHIVEWGSREGCHICALTAKVRADESAREKYEQLAPSTHVEPSDERVEFEVKADTLLGVFCNGNLQEYLNEYESINWEKWQRLADYVNKTARASLERRK